MRAIFISLRYLIFMSLFLGILYPLFSTALGGFLFPRRSAGSLVVINGEVRGSELLAQKFTQEKYFWPRPSAVDYQTASGGGSNRSATHKALKEEVLARMVTLGAKAPVDMLYASGSGLDPHISPEAALFQAPRVALARGISKDELNKFIKKSTDSKLLGFMGQDRVNVLELNQLLDKSQP